jgi:hypothetical protein
MRNDLIESLESRHLLSGVPPIAPTGLVETTSSDSAISLSWTDKSDNEMGFRVDRWNGHGWSGVAKVKANTTTFIDTHLKAGRFYAYRVFAFNKAGNSSLPAFLGNASTLAKGATIAPSALAATVVSASDIVLQFSDNATNEAGYNVQVSVNGGAWTTAGGVPGTQSTGVRAFDFGGVQSRQSYSFRIATYTAIRFGDYTVPVAAANPVADTASPVLARGQHYTSDVTVIPGVNSPEPIQVVNLHLLNADGTPDTDFAGTGTGTIAETANADQQPAQFIAGLPNGLILETLTGETHQTVPANSTFYTWFEGVEVLAESATSLGFGFTTLHTSDPQPTAPPPLRMFVQPDGQILLASNGVGNAAVNNGALTPAITVVDDLAHLVWTHPLATAADSVIGLPNDLVAVVSAGHVTVFSSTGQKIAGP